MGYPIFRPRISLEPYKRVSHFLKSQFFFPAKKRDLKIFYPFWWTTKPGFGKRGMQKGLSWGWTNQWISRIKILMVFFSVHWCKVNLQMLGNTCDSSEPEIFRFCRSPGGLPSNESETFIFLLDICGSHQKPQPMSLLVLPSGYDIHKLPWKDPPCY